MKKIYIGIFFYFIFINNVFANTNFIQYKDNDTNLKLEFKYKWYQETKEGEYLPIDEQSDKWNYIDNTNIIYGDYSNWNDDCNINDPSLNKDMKLVYSYREIVPTKYIILKSFSTTFKINDINIFNNLKEIDYKILNCENCDLKNNILNSNSILTIELDSYYKSWELSFHIDLESNDSKINQYKIFLYKDIENKLNSGAGNKIIYDSINTKNFKVDSSWMTKTSYTDILYSDEKVSPNYYNLLSGSKIMCRYRKIYNYRYNIIKKYYDNNYYNFINDYQKDSNDFLIYYKYKSNDTNLKNNIITKVEKIKKENNNKSCKPKIMIKTKIKYIEKKNTKLFKITVLSLVINLFVLIYSIYQFCRLKLL